MNRTPLRRWFILRLADPGGGVHRLPGIVESMSTEATPAHAQSFRPTLIALIVAAAFFMETLDGTVIATALPSMAQSFGVGAIQLSIGITAYMLTLAIFIPASSWLADRFGTRTIFCGAIGVFTLTSIGCGIAPDFYSFIAARVVRGVGGGMLPPSAPCQSRPTSTRSSSSPAPWR